MNTAYLKLVQLQGWVTACILALLPFHAFLTVWLSTLVGHYTALRLWKEVLLVGLVVGSLIVLARSSVSRRQLSRATWFWLIVAYGLLLLLSGVVALQQQTVTPKAFAYGLLLDGRFLLFFITTYIIAWQHAWLRQHWRGLILWPAGVVVAIGLLQYFVLPPDVLRHFGYGPDTIPAVSTIDQKLEYQRIASTLRGANPFGAYLVLIISLLGALVLRRPKFDWRSAVLLMASFVVLAVTFSRSAWIGVVVSLAVLLGLSIWHRVSRRWLLLGVAAGFMTFASVGYILRENDTFQNAFFHTDEHSRSAISSNEGRLGALQSGVRDLVHEPLGRGTGTAGPASVYNQPHGVRLAENYFLQIGQEIGVIGLGLFVAINGVIAWKFWKQRDQLLPLVLLASFMGLTVINLLSHAWTDDTLAYIWWGLAGVALAAGEQKQNGYEAA
ncbi:MAG TPA: O-antigen ligase family protein, partial [Candidatus Limnocylindrales bacterium]|nr:O-antigen ligase family protein [Candidatus Limnocylindrales bacterium]